jgi:mitochondrial fission protein ELM1
MGFLELRSSVKFLNPPDPRRAACVRAAPDRVVFPVEPGLAPSPKPPVRIFLGTEPGQYRAERVFVWSIQQHRDPSRVYEVYLMKDLVGFDRRGWTTGFTNYRFAIPHLAGGRGKAIFNDVDEAYFGDPAGLFDLDLGGHGYLSTSDSETSVMLIDCERMAPLWSLERAQRELKKEILRRTLAVPGIRGDLPPEWTARDEEFEPGRSRLQHWTTLHTQPWRPLPGRFVYQPNPTGHLWFDLERSADAAGYQVFGAERPSARFGELVARLRAAPRTPRAGRPSARDLPAPGGGAPGVEEERASLRARSFLDVGLGWSSQSGAGAPAAGTALHDLAFDGPPASAGPRADGVACQETLEYLSDDDVPWVVDALFERAGRFVYAVVGNDGRSARLADGTRLRSQARAPDWWQGFFEKAGARRPELRWTLVLRGRDRLGRASVRVRRGGVHSEQPPRVWVLSDERPENRVQALALADALGWPWEHKDLAFSGLGRLLGPWLGASRLGLDGARSDRIEPPWPDIVIAAGRRSACVARWIRAQTLGRARLVAVGRDAASPAERFDAAVSPGYSRLWPNPRRIETGLLLTPSGSKRLARVRGGAGAWRAGDASPRLGLLLAGAARRGHLDASSARSLGEALAHRVSGGSVVAALGADAAPEVVSALVDGLGDVGRLYRSGSADPVGALREVADGADRVVVCAGDELALAEAVSAGKPVEVRSGGAPREDLLRRLRRRVVARAHARPVNARGTPRPQQGLEYLCARWIERGWLLPPHDPEEITRQLERDGRVTRFGADAPAAQPPAAREVESVALRVKQRLGYAAPRSGAPEVKSRG